MWKPIRELKEPFNDAVNYASRSDKEFFNKIFLRTDELQKCLSPSVYFLMGEKGAGKTAYATYIENNSLDNTKCRVVTMTETQYKRFVELKRDGKLTYSDYGNIWRFILLLVASQVIIEKSKNLLNSWTGKFSRIESVLKRWNQNGLNPEIETAFEAVRKDAFSIGFGKKDVAAINSDESDTNTERRSGISHNLLEGELALKEAIAELKLGSNIVVFVDGVDFRPESIGYRDYLDCVKGLGEAVWQINTEFFRNIRDSKGRIKVVMLIRPDVFHSLNLYNSNSRIQDNCVLLEWATTDKTYASSNLYEACAKFFSSQQPQKVEPIVAWSHYFPSSESFKRMLRFSFQKPRDILTFVKLIRGIQVKRGRGEETQFDETILSDATFTKEAADYLLGEVRNYAAFYMTPEDFSIYLKFFQYLDGKSQFDMAAFNAAFAKFADWAKGEEIQARAYVRDADALLQFFYDVNVIGYKEFASDSSETFFHWSFRERSLNNLAPKVKSVESLMINPGVSKALDIGKNMVASNAGGKPRAKRPHRFKRGGRKPRSGGPKGSGP